MILLYGYFEDYLVKLLIERGCVPVFNSLVKFTDWLFQGFLQCIFSHIFSEISGCILLKYSKK